MSLEKLKQVTEIQCASGNWNFDPYMHGMANGLILALSIMETGGKEEPKFLEAPGQWLCNRILDGDPTQGSSTQAASISSEEQ